MTKQLQTTSAMWRLLLIFLTAFAATACATVDRHVNHSGHSVVQLVDESLHAHDALLVAVTAYRAGAGDWPKSPDALRESSYLDALLELNRYENLFFEPTPDGDLVITFDRWTSTSEDVVIEGARIRLTEPKD